MDSWLSPLGIPEAHKAHGGGNFDVEFWDILEPLGVAAKKSAPYALTRNAPVERVGGARGHCARVFIDPSQLTSDHPWQACWLCVVAIWARDSELDGSPGQSVLRRRLKLPSDALSPSPRLAVMSRIRGSDFTHRLSMMQHALRAARSIRFSRGLRAALTIRSRALCTLSATAKMSIRDQVMNWRGARKKKKSDCAERWEGPGLIAGVHGNSCWVSQKTTITPMHLNLRFYQRLILLGAAHLSCKPQSVHSILDDRIVIGTLAATYYDLPVLRYPPPFHFRHGIGSPIVFLFSGAQFSWMVR